MIESNIINPISFHNDTINTDINTTFLYPYYNRITHELNFDNYYEKLNNYSLCLIVRNYIKDNICDICNVFYLRLLNESYNNEESESIIDNENKDMFLDLFNRENIFNLIVANIIESVSNNASLHVSAFQYLSDALYSFVYSSIDYRIRNLSLNSNTYISLYTNLYTICYGEEPKNIPDIATSYIFTSSILREILSSHHLEIKKCVDSISLTAYNMIVNGGKFVSDKLLDTANSELNQEGE